jgi:hypothetical protein
MAEEQFLAMLRFEGRSKLEELSVSEESDTCTALRVQ